jgi:hypothetical protein
MMSSIDGYCSAVVFDDGELGQPLGTVSTVPSS